MLEKMLRKGNPPILLVGNKLVEPLWRRVWRFIKTQNTELPYDQAIPCLHIYPEGTIIQKDTCIPIFIAALFTFSQDMDAT